MVNILEWNTTSQGLYSTYKLIFALQYNNRCVFHIFSYNCLYIFLITIYIYITFYKVKVWPLNSAASFTDFLLKDNLTD